MPSGAAEAAAEDVAVAVASEQDDLDILQRKSLVGIATREVNSLHPTLRQALSAVEPPLHTTQHAAWQRYRTFVRWARSKGLDHRSPVTVFAWLATKIETCLPETLSTYRTNIATIMHALGHVSAGTRERMCSIKITGRIRDVIDVLEAREARAITPHDIHRLFSNPSLLMPSRIRLFIAFITHSRAGVRGDLQELQPKRICASTTRPGFWVLYLAGITKPSRKANIKRALQRLDHVVMLRFPPPVNDYLRATLNNSRVQFPLALQEADRQAIAELGKGVHSLKHAAIRSLSEVLDGCPFADTIGLIAGRHSAPTNAPSVRGHYTDRAALERDLWAKRVPHALTLLSDWLATKIGWPPVLTPEERKALQCELGIQRPRDSFLCAEPACAPRY